MCFWLFKKISSVIYCFSLKLDEQHSVIKECKDTWNFEQQSLLPQLNARKNAEELKTFTEMSFGTFYLVHMHKKIVASYFITNKSD